MMKWVPDESIMKKDEEHFKHMTPNEICLFYDVIELGRVFDYGESE